MMTPAAYPPALATQDSDDLVAQVRDIRLDQARIADHAMSDVIRLQAPVGANEQRRAEGRLDLLQCLARARLRQRDLPGGLQERAVLAQRDQEPQLLQVKP
jgi:hypothetical protein